MMPPFMLGSLARYPRVHETTPVSVTPSIRARSKASEGRRRRCPDRSWYSSVFVGHSLIAVPLDLVNPVGPVGRTVDFRRITRLNVAAQHRRARLPATARGHSTSLPFPALSTSSK